MNIQDIRTQTSALCTKLDELGHQLIEGSLSIADVRADFEKRYQPEALRLTDFLTMLVRLETPGIRVEFSGGNMRRVTFSDRPTISCPLPINETDAHLAGVQFERMASILRKLASALPEPVEA